MTEAIKKNRNIFLVLIDILIIFISYSVSIFFLSVQITDVKTLAIESAIAIIIYELILNIFQMYRNMMRYEVGKDYVKYIISAIISVIIISIIAFVFDFEYLNFKLNVLSGILIAGAFVMYRLAGRSILNRRMSKKENKEKQDTNIRKNNLLIIGAGWGAREIIIAIKNSMKDKYNIVGIVDDNIGKLNHYILGVKVIRHKI